jgi:hypothetical protein
MSTDQQTQPTADQGFALPEESAQAMADFKADYTPKQPSPPAIEDLKAKVSDWMQAKLQELTTEKPALHAVPDEWVKLEEGCNMPDYDVPVLWFFEDGQMQVMDLDKDGNDWLYLTEIEGFPVSKPTHWMPLPPPPAQLQQLKPSPATPVASVADKQLPLSEGGEFLCRSCKKPMDEDEGRWGFCFDCYVEQ